VRCAPGDAPEAIRSDLLVDVLPAHVHLARIRGDGGEAELVLDAQHRERPVHAERGGVWAWIRLGIEHILTGWDHLAFVLALILTGARLGRTAWLITGFTAGHSLTLALAAFGITRPDARLTEVLIASSIALVAAENVWVTRRQSSLHIPAAVVASILVAAVFAGNAAWSLALGGVALFAACHFALLGRRDVRWFIAALFGLVHGFGFAGVLAELDLPRQRLAGALLAFNAGVEIGQLAVVSAVWPLIAWAARRPPLRLAVVEIASAVLAGAGVFWFVARAA
jgi:hypothetical protein